MIIKMEQLEHTKNPINKGSTVSEIYLPIKTLMDTAIRVEIKPVIAEAIPAICPTGCIAIALKLPNKKPMVKNWAAKNNNNTSIDGFFVWEKSRT